MNAAGDRIFRPLPAGTRDRIAGAVFLSAVVHGGAILLLAPGAPEKELAFSAGGVTVIDVALVEGSAGGATGAAGGISGKESDQPAPDALSESRSGPADRVAMPDRAVSAERLGQADLAPADSVTKTLPMVAEAAPVPPPKPSPPATGVPKSTGAGQPVAGTAQLASRADQPHGAKATARATSERDSGAADGSPGSTGREAEGASPRADNPAPSYPFAARRRGQEGRVLLRVEVSPAGDAADVHIEESSGVASLDRAASDAVRRWRFHPARRNGRPVQATVQVPIRFALK